MKKNMHSVLALISLTAFLFTVMAFAFHRVSDDWSVPAKYKNMKNPYPGKDVDGVGEELYKRHCRSCHGREGYGDGPKAGELETEMRDLTSEEVQAQTDGELYYKGIIGRDEMPNFEKKIKDVKDRWMVVNYLRELAE